MIFPGKDLFELKATYGLPLEIAVDEIYSKNGIVEWASFIEEARKNEWWDFKTYDAIKYALEDAGINKKTKEEILKRFKIYVLKYPHPKMREKRL